MITVVYNRTRHTLTMEGHAQSGEPGHDLVCASASILAYTLASSVSNMAEVEQVREPVLKLNKGEARVSCKPRTRFTSAVTLIFDSICAGFELLATNYPENISYQLRI